MQYFLAKTEPSVYSIDEMEKIGEDFWDGVNNPLANRFLREMKIGDFVLIYHSGISDPAIVGIAKVSREAEPDKNNPKSWVPWFRFVKKLPTPVTLKEIKDSNLFDDWYLVKQGRLSTMPVPEKFVEWLKKKGVTFKYSRD
jgi:predicted RNA-binding protein with PUA-like domain